MKKGKFWMIILVFIQFLLITSSISAVNFNSDIDQNEISNIKSMKINNSFSKPVIKYNNKFVNVHLGDCSSYSSSIGEPVLPVLIKTFEFPFGTKIKDIKYSFTDINSLFLTKKIAPKQRPFISTYDYNTYSNNIDNEIYYKNSLFPKKWFEYKLTGGLNKDNIQTTFLTIKFYPVRYNPVENKIYFIDSIELNIIYEDPKENYFLNDDYDLLIISYDRYLSKLEKLVDHKNKYRINTKLVGLSDIYDGEYFEIQGEDNQEKIKYFIKNAKESWGIIYVMLVGNFRKLPKRFAHLQTDPGGFYEELYFSCDLYYADIYDGEGNFSSWDTNDNGLYGEWTTYMVDEVDLVPDVYVGRLACMFGFEVTTMVNKIIEYEENAYDSDWFKNMIVCGGDTFDEESYGYGTDYDEGEVANEKALEYMTGFEHIRLYASDDTLKTANIHEELSKGAGFIYFVGHGSPKNWGTHYNDDYVNWTEGFTNQDILKLFHKGKYPVLMVGGCHNSQFDVTPLNIIKGLLEDGLDYFAFTNDSFGKYWLSNWVPECWGWVFVKKRFGGAIASMGSTGYGGVDVGDIDDNGIPDCIEGMDGWFETQFFRLYNQENITILGETYGQTITDYVHNFPVYDDRYDCKIVETHVLLGDPSLKIGGYP